MRFKLASAGLAACVALALAVAISCGCSSFLEMPASQYLEPHGKAGKAFAYFPGLLVAAPAYVVCAPFTLPVDYQTWRDNQPCIMEMPRNCSFYVPSKIQRGFYYAGAGIAWPFCAWDFSPELGSLPKSERDELLFQNLHFLNEPDYALLVQDSGRAFPPPFSAGELYGNDGRAFISFGMKPILDMDIWLDWEDWLASGRPVGGLAERRFLVKHYVYGFNYKSGSMRHLSVPSWTEDALKRIFMERDPSLSEADFKDCRDSVSWEKWIDARGGLDALSPLDKKGGVR